MKLTCQIVRDLLPLYEDNICSGESRAAVDEHLCSCEACAREHRQLHAFTVVLPEKSLPEKAAAKSFRKVRRRWALSLAAVLILMPLLMGLGWMSFNQSRQEGICFTNLDEAALASRFGRLLAAKNYEKAAHFLDFSRDYDSIQEALALTEEAYFPDLVSIRVDGESYMARPQLVDQLENNGSFWHELILNAEYYRTLIPEKVFLEVAAQSQELVLDGDGMYYRADGNASFLLLELDWGRFYVTENNWMDLYRKKDDPDRLCHSLDLLPQSLYQQALPALKENAKEAWQSSQDWNSPYAGVSLEEYAAQQRDLFGQEVGRIAKDMTIEYKGIGSAYCIEGTWSVVIDLDVTTGSETQRISLDLRIGDGKLLIIASASDPSIRGTVFEDLTNALLLDIPTETQ